jgi:hypothetical protein
MVLNDQYDKHLSPSPDGVNVDIELALQTFYNVDERSASFTADVLMRLIFEFVNHVNLVKYGKTSVYDMICTRVVWRI